VFANQLSFIISQLKTDGSKDLVHLLSISFHAGSGQLVNRVHYESTEGSLQWLAFSIVGFLSPLLSGCVEEMVTPEFLHHEFHVLLELGSIHVGESSQSETPLFFSGSEGNVTKVGKQLESTHLFVFIGRDNDIDHIDHSYEVLVHAFRIGLQFQDLSIDLVDHEDGPDSFGHSLSEYSFSLDTDTFYTIDHDQSTISNSEGSSHFRGEVNMSWGINKIDEILLRLSVGPDVVLVVETHTCGFDSDSSFLFICSGVHVPGFTCMFVSYDTSLADQRV